jgi:putative flippase GtrA
MFAKIITQISQRRQFVVYACIGLVGVSLDLTSFTVFDRLLGWHYQFANVVSTSLGIFVNFLLNVRFNFKVRDRLLVRFGSFYAVGLTGMGATALLLALFVGWLAMPAVPVKFGTLVIVLLLQYNLNRWLTFRKNLVPVDSVSR